MKKLLILLVLLYPSVPVHAVIESMPFDDPAQEERYKNLIAELRCLVCQNQNLADSNAELAKDLRRQTFELIRSGASDSEIVDYMVTRYGDFVLYRPPFKTTTVPLWVGPFVLLALGVGGLWFVIRRRTRARPEDITDAELSKVRNLLDRDE